MLNATGIRKFFDWVWEREQSIPHFDFHQYIKKDATGVLDAFCLEWRDKGTSHDTCTYLLSEYPVRDPSYKKSIERQLMELEDKLFDIDLWNMRRSQQLYLKVDNILENVQLTPQVHAQICGCLTK
jgi:hypothetical protein